MALNLARLSRDPVFRWGLVLRVVLIVLLVPQIQAQWFVPFVVHAIEQPSLDPWSTYLAAGGDALAFPYGPVMLVAHLPTTFLGWLVDLAAGTGFLAGLGFRVSLLVVDAALLSLLYRLWPEQPRKLLWVYWWSPIVLYVTYWNGQTDIVPVALVMLSLYYVKRADATRSAIALGLAVAAKLSMLLALPFVAIYLWRNKGLRPLVRPYAVALAATLAIVQLPYAFSAGFRQMVFGTHEAARLFDLALPIGDAYHLYLTPTVYLLALYAVWRLRRISFDLLIATTGLSFFLLVLATPAPPGWYLWLVPFLVAHQLQGDRSALALAGGFSAVLIGMHLFTSAGVTMPLVHLDPGALFAQAGMRVTPHVRSLWITAIVAMGLVLLVQMLRERITRNDYFRIAQRPVTVGIAGDSGSGKDTLSRAIAGLFGEHSVAHVSGDDYHVWDRYAPMWQGLTHLDPRGNDLQRFNHDVLALMDGKAILCRRYDHHAGRFTPPSLTQKNEVIIASGLHALLTHRLRNRFDVTVYLDVDERLRRSWKIARDVHQRGHALEKVLASIERRMADAVKFVQPQRAHAGLVLSLQPVNARRLETAANPDDVRLKLVARIRDSSSHEKLARLLIGICGLHLDVQPSDDSGDVTLSIEGDVAAEDIALAAHTLVPGLREMLDVDPHWEGGMTGIMQLLVLLQIEESLKGRIA